MMKTTTKFVFALCTVLGLASCAQSPSSGSHDPQPRARSYSDTLDHVRGRGSVHAPSQIQIGSGNLDRKEHKTQDQEVIESREVRELLEPRTFLGTIPCPSGDRSCQPIRVSVTFAPAGMWRLQAQSAADSTVTRHHAQGCWYRTGSEPTRVALISERDTVVGDFTFLNDRQLKVNRFNQYEPVLATSLTRQRDIDPIEALDNEPAPNCRGIDEADLEEMQEELIIPEH